jgi:hypothetical protein
MLVVGILKINVKDIDEKICQAIDAIPGLVTKNALIKEMGGIAWRIAKLLTIRFSQNPKLQKRVDEKNLHIIHTCDDSTFDEFVMERCQTKLFGEVRQEFEKRKDERIIGAIRAYEDGIPNKSNLGKSKKPVPYTSTIIIKRINANPLLAAEFEKRAIEHIQDLDQAGFDKLVCSKTWTQTSSAVKAAIRERLIEIISRIIPLMSGRINGNSLCKKGGGPLPYDSKTINDLIHASSWLQEQIELREMANFSTIRKPRSIKSPQIVAGKTLRCK